MHENVTQNALRGKIKEYGKSIFRTSALCYSDAIFLDVVGRVLESHIASDFLKSHVMKMKTVVDESRRSAKKRIEHVPAN